MLKAFATVFYAHIAVSATCLAVSYICSVIMTKRGKSLSSRDEAGDKKEILENRVSDRFGVDLSAAEIVFLSFFIPALNLYMAKQFIIGATTKSN